MADNISNQASADQALASQNAEQTASEPVNNELANHEQINSEQIDNKSASGHKDGQLAVYYNSACPVCKAGINSQQQKDSACAIEWNDIHNDPERLAEYDAELEFVRKRLHVVDKNGEMQIGFDAFLALWRQSPSEQWKAKFFSLPVIKQVCRLAYNWFAYLLYRWNKANNHW